MKQDKERRKDTQEYQFIQETIKKPPIERRVLATAGCGILFGGCAAVTFAGVFPVLADKEENTQQRIELTESDIADSEETSTENRYTEEGVESFSSRSFGNSWPQSRRTRGRI